MLGNRSDVSCSFFQLETQTSLIEDLHSEIDKLKKSMNDSQETQF